MEGRGESMRTSWARLQAQPAPVWASRWAAALQVRSPGKKYLYAITTLLTAEFKGLSCIRYLILDTSPSDWMDGPRRCFRGTDGLKLPHLDATLCLRIRCFTLHIITSAPGCSSTYVVGMGARLTEHAGKASCYCPGELTAVVTFGGVPGLVPKKRER